VKTGLGLGLELAITVQFMTVQILTVQIKTSDVECPHENSPTACVGGIEAASVNGRVRAELDPETVGLGLDDIGGRAVAAESGEYLAVLVSVSHLHAAHRRPATHSPRAVIIIIIIIIIRPHWSVEYVDAAYCYRPSSMVCRSVCLSH